MLTSAKVETQTKSRLMFRMQLMRGTQQCPPLPCDSADKESMVVESEEISEIGKHAIFSSAAR